MKQNTDVLLETVKTTANNWNEKIIKSGIDFNIISILGMENNERYTHSAFIAELLNPKGRHGQKSLFLDLFLAACEINDFTYKHEGAIMVEVEKHIREITVNMGEETYSSRTYLDIVITNTDSNESIFIENKIWAIDQKYQLERYNKLKPHTLLYLTVDGKEYSTTDKDLTYKIISYEKHIIKWLELCIQAVQSISEKQALTIEMYKDVIEKLTNQSIYKNMSEDIKKDILLNEENFKAAELIFNNYLQIKQDYFFKFKTSFEAAFQTRNFERFSVLGNFNYGIDIDTDEGSIEVYLGIKPAGKEKLNEDEKNMARAEIQNILHEFTPNINSTNYWPIWFNPKQGSLLQNGDLTFKNLNYNQLHELYENTDAHTSEIAEYFISILEKLKNHLNNQ
ncbi:MAG: PD-(D/E)XK nuclease family protein [Bacteroidia bacterium]|nr:PD-(D/E)XK nuclease family protein [Bacteroidia bacterium]